MSKMQLTLFENDTVQIAPSSDEEKTITDKQAEDLIQLNSKLRANKYIDNDFFQYESKHTAKFIKIYFSLRYYFWKNILNFFYVLYYQVF